MVYSDFSKGDESHQHIQDLRMQTMEAFQQLADQSGIRVGVNCGIVTYGSVIVEVKATDDTSETALHDLRQRVIQMVYTKRFVVMGHRAVAFRMPVITTTTTTVSAFGPANGFGSNATNATDVNGTSTTTARVEVAKDDSASLSSQIGLVLGIALGTLIVLTLVVTLLFRSMARMPPKMEMPNNGAPAHMRIMAVPGPSYGAGSSAAQYTESQPHLPPDGASMILGQMWDSEGARYGLGGRKEGNTPTHGYGNPAYRLPNAPPSSVRAPAPDYMASSLQQDYLSLNNNSGFAASPLDAGDATYLSLAESKYSALQSSPQDTYLSLAGRHSFGNLHNSPNDEYITMVPPPVTYGDANQDVYVKLEAAKALVQEASKELNSFNSSESLQTPSFLQSAGATTVGHFYPSDSAMHGNWNK